MVKCKRQGCFNKAEPDSAFCKECIADLKHAAMAEAEHPEPRKQEKAKTPPPKNSSSYNYWRGYNPERDKLVDMGIKAGWKLFTKLLRS